MYARNYHVYNTDPEILQTLLEEYKTLGRDGKIEGDRLTVFAYRQKPVKKKVADKKDRPESKERREQRPKSRE